MKFDFNNTVFIVYFTNGGIMRRLLRLGTLLLAIMLMAGASYAQKPRVQVSGRIAANHVRVFTKDSVYEVSGTYMIAGTLLIEPGTEVVFLDNGRLIDSVGGRLLADGEMQASYTNAAPGVGVPYNSWSYFTRPNVVSVNTKEELTVAAGKRNIVFNLVVDTVKRKIVNLKNMVDGSENSVYTSEGDAGYVVSPEKAMMYLMSRLYSDDDIVRFSPWRRAGGLTPNISRAQIVFRGQAVNDYSREWGHIIVLPGARAAYFRNVVFKDFRKDTTVDNRGYYDTANVAPGVSAAISQLNKDILKLTNGAGGALTSFSARTWLVDCQFINNMARFRAGALQMVQPPFGVGAYPDTTGIGIGNYMLDKNPNITNPDGTLLGYQGGGYFDTTDFRKINSRILKLDELDIDAVPSTEPTISQNNAARQSVDDPRIGVLLGRVRRLTFDNNRVLVSLVDTLKTGTRRVLVDDTSRIVPLDYDGANISDWKNQAFGGAMYIGGRFTDEYRKIEIGLGVNDSIRVDGSNPFAKIRFNEKDFVKFINNKVVNRQDGLLSRGAKGGALYIGAYTSVIINGEFRNNSATTPYLLPKNSADYALGGAIFHENSLCRLQVRGSSVQGTDFVNNRASSGGAIYVDGNTDSTFSPIIGGSDLNRPLIRDYGRRINFENNAALAHGGAIFTKRNMTVYGAGGFINDLPLAQSYGPGFSINFLRNRAGYSGGAVAIHLPSIEPPVPASQRVCRFVRADFRENVVGQIGINPTIEEQKFIRGGGGIYSMNADLNLVKAVLFENNKALSSNGGAIAMVHPRTSSDRLFISDADFFVINPNSGVIDRASFIATDSIFNNKQVSAVPADVRMLTRFINNSADINPDPSLMGTGTTQSAANYVDIKRYHPGYIVNATRAGLRENGVGLGGAIYVLDSVTSNRAFRDDTIFFNRVRIQNNIAYTGAALYSDNYNLRFLFQRSLITGNEATSTVGTSEDVIGGPYINPSHPASSDLASAILYGEIIGPGYNSFKLPANPTLVDQARHDATKVDITNGSTSGNSFYDNKARFLIRLPDAANTKGTLAGGYGTGIGGVDTLRGNYWGKTEANVTTVLNTLQPGFSYGGIQETFFVRGNGATHLRFINKAAGTYINLTEQGPFEYNGTNAPGRVGLDYAYKPLTVGTIPDTLLMQGLVYDIFDKGTDINTADYSNRRMSPIEDFAVGIPANLQLYPTSGTQSSGKQIRRTTRDPFATDSMNYSTDKENLLWRSMRKLQSEFAIDQRTNEYTHPIGYPLFLEARAAYNGADANQSNDDALSLNESVFFVINDSTGDFIRMNMRQMTDIPTKDNDNVYPREYLRGRVDFVADSSTRTGTTSRVRRNYESLANYGGTNSLLPAIADNAVREDSSALAGRRYEMEFSGNQLVYDNNNNVVYSNRSDLPASVKNGTNNKVTYFAGEKFRTLPVRPTDYVRVVSRTTLWREGVDAAIAKGVGFRVGSTVAPPVFTGTKVTVENPNVSPQYISSFKNKVFVNEDISYNRAPNSNNKGRDTLFVITAIDSNKFYDPRWALDIDANGNVRTDKVLKEYNQLEYAWFPLFQNPNGSFTPDTSVTKLTALRRWMKADTVWPYIKRTSHPYYGATGRIELKGKPSNPYVVPGGEFVEVSARNYAPTYRSADALNSILLADSAFKKSILGSYLTDPSKLEATFQKEIVSKFIYLYPSYFHAQAYDSPDNARYLNQDTIDFGNNGKITYRFSVHVIDSVPVYLTTTQTSANCPIAGANQNLFVANVTDKLRFFVDMNTDDEKEDSIAQNNEGWDFKYGRTSYSFLSKTIRPVDDTSSDELSIVRPNWLTEKYYFKDASDTQVDAFAYDFTTYGVLNVRISRAEALALLKPGANVDQSNGGLNTDSMMTIVVNDGHSGVSYLTKRIFINVSPTITNQNPLPTAKEGVDYNPALLDPAKAITYEDPNFGQEQTFELIYAAETRDSIAKDPCFPEAGYWNLKDIKVTPNWLHINPKSGLLSGNPGVKDAPRKIATGNPDTVTVLITDKGGLTDLKTLVLEVDSTNHAPRAKASPSIRCIANGVDYIDSMIVSDIDLLRQEPNEGKEIIKISIDPPIGNVTVEPSEIKGSVADTNAAMNNNIIIKSNGVLNIPANLINNGKVTIRVKFDDGDTVTYTEYKVNVSDVTDFTTTIRVENSLGAFQDLYFGTARNATTGEKLPDEGKLDANYCEFELPPFPPTDVFDARWTIVKTNGIHRNIFPTAIKGDSTRSIYKGRFQAGAELGNTSPTFPVKLKWKKSTVPTRRDAVKNPSGGSWRIMDGGSFNYFQVDMATGSGKKSELIDTSSSGDEYTISIKQDVVNSFVILYDHASNVNEDQPTSVMGQSIVSEAVPNPANETVNFSITSSRENVEVQIYDMLGNLVNRFNSDLTIGTSIVSWNTNDASGKPVATGVYNVRLTVGSDIINRNVVVAR